ncbi:hypothetical protein CANCADRAFT_11320, partial [Tortispora caseinolytica NRRL Y-17796]
EDEHEQEIVNVDFDFFDTKEIDFEAIQNLLRQLFNVDGPLFDLTSLADIIIKQNIGSSVKCDGEDSDPFAFLSVVSLKRPEPVTGSLLKYIHSKIDDSFRTTLNSKLESTGLILSERLLNMPTEVMPHMYRMLLEELKTATSKGELPDLDTFVLVSRTFTATSSEIDDPKPKKKKKAAESEMFYFHPEDEVMLRHAKHYASYEFTRPPEEADSRRTFQDYGIFPKGILILLDKAGLEVSIREMLELFP